MKGFLAYLAKVKDVGSWLVKGVVAVPLVALLADVVPPWPSKAAVTGLTCVLEVLLLMYAYEAWSRRSQPLLLRRLRRTGLAAALLLLVYLAGLAFFTHAPRAPDHGRMAIGFAYAPYAETLIARMKWDREAALKANEWNPARIWTEASIQTVQVGLLAAWFGFFASVTAFVGAFVARKRR